jgi:hypothetical protein
MRNKKNNFKPSSLQVPYDSTWITKDTLEIGPKNDTTWIKRAEKFYKNVNEINSEYLSDKGGNRKISRNASFTKKFRWFNTIFRFSEKIDKSLLYGYSLEDYFTKDELDFCYLPESVSLEKLTGSDSVKYKALSDTIETKSNRWFWFCTASEWIEEFTKLTAGRTGMELSRETLKAREKEVVDTLLKNMSSDSALINNFLGESNYMKYRAEADSSTEIIRRHLDTNIEFLKYTVKFIMPGKIIGSNGFLNREGELIWPVKSEFFLSQPYEMWAESKIPNSWAWVVSGLFLIFVLTGVIIRKIKRG